jgi:hypothetical protein
MYAIFYGLKWKLLSSLNKSVLDYLEWLQRQAKSRGTLRFLARFILQLAFWKVRCRIHAP